MLSLARWVFAESDRVLRDKKSPQALIDVNRAVMLGLQPVITPTAGPRVMSLILKLAPGERLFINGAVVTNGDRRAYLMVETKAQIVREKDVLMLEDVSTPVQARLLRRPRRAAECAARARQQRWLLPSNWRDCAASF
jgi:hypothetical protein